MQLRHFLAKTYLFERKYKEAKKELDEIIDGGVNSSGVPLFNLKNSMKIIFIHRRKTDPNQFLLFNHRWTREQVGSMVISGIIQPILDYYLRMGVFSSFPIPGKSF